MLAERYGAVVVSPEYRLAGEAPYPAALEDCYAALVWMYEHADELGIDQTKIVVGGAVMTKEYAASIGADQYAKDAMDTVRYAETVNDSLVND